MMLEEYVNRLLEAANKKYSLLKDILFISQSQSQSMTEDGVEDLEKLVVEKQSRIDEINKVDEEFDVYFRRLKQVLGVKNLDELQKPDIKGIKELQDSIGRIMALIHEISEIEKQNSQQAKKLLDSLGNEIKKINQGKKVTSVYNPGPMMQPPSYFIDKKK